MGGNALKNVKTYRKSADEYKKIKDEVFSKLRSLGIVHSEVVELPGKESFGDLDVLIQYISGMDKRAIIKEFMPREIFANGDVYSFDYGTDEPFQVDFIFVNSLDMAQFYFNYGDVGGIIGRICSSIGLKIGHKGLKLNLLENTVCPQKQMNHCVSLGEINLSTDPVEICKFLGFDWQVWHNGFENKEQIFDWITSSKYYSPSIFLDLNHDHRKRSVKRPFYMAFLQHIGITEIQSHMGHHTETKQNFAIDYFSKREEVDEIIMENERKEQLKQKFNGRMFIDCGVSGKDVGTKMTLFKQQFSDFEQVLENSTTDEMALRIKEFLGA